jgi:hypothetical protein
MTTSSLTEIRTRNQESTSKWEGWMEVMMVTMIHKPKRNNTNGRDGSDTKTWFKANQIIDTTCNNFNYVFIGPEG